MNIQIVQMNIVQMNLKIVQMKKNCSNEQFIQFPGEFPIPNCIGVEIPQISKKSGKIPPVGNEPRGNKPFEFPT